MPRERFGPFVQDAERSLRLRVAVEELVGREPEQRHERQ